MVVCEKGVGARLRDCLPDVIDDHVAIHLFLANMIRAFEVSVLHGLCHWRLGTELNALHARPLFHYQSWL